MPLFTRRHSVLLSVVYHTVYPVSRKEVIELKLWEVRFQLISGAIFKSFVPAYSNGGAENKVLDLLRDRCKRCLAFDTEGQAIAETLYPNPQLVDCTLIATL